MWRDITPTLVVYIPIMGWPSQSELSAHDARVPSAETKIVVLQYSEQIFVFWKPSGLLLLLNGTYIPTCEDMAKLRRNLAPDRRTEAQDWLLVKICNTTTGLSSFDFPPKNRLYMIDRHQGAENAVLHGHGQPLSRPVNDGESKTSRLDMGALHRKYVRALHNA